MLQYIYQMNEGSFKILIITLMIMSGTINTIAYKFQNKQIVYQGPYYKYFFHPYMQAVVMFFGETMVLGIYYIMKFKNPEAHKASVEKALAQGKIMKVNKLIFLIPAGCDFITSTLQHTALNFVPGSVYQMMRGGTIITTFIFSILFLKSKILKHQIFGSVFALIGISVVGFSNLYFTDRSSQGVTPGQQIMGYILLIISLFSNGFYFVFQQKLLHKYHLEPLEIVGWEGVFGLSLYAVALPIMNFMPCNFGIEACVFNHKGVPYIEDTLMYFREWGQSGILTFFCILSIFSIVTFNISGVSVTKYINALARSICDVTRTILVWSISIIITITLGAKYNNYRWQIVGVGAIIVEMIGFFILVFGNLIYNQFIIIPYLHQTPPEKSQLLTETSNIDLDISLQKKGLSEQNQRQS